VLFLPKKEWLRIEVRLERSDQTQAQLEQAGLDLMDYDARWGRYRIRLSGGDVKNHEGILTTLLMQSYEDVS
jgi:hypothetical protein